MTAHDHDLGFRGDTPRGDVVLVTDASAEGEVLASALRGRGFEVHDVPLALLEARVVHERPDVLVIDIDESGAGEAVDRVRELAAGAAAEIVCVGDPIRAAELGLAMAFERPVDVLALVAHVVRIASAPIERGSHRAAPTAPPSSPARRERRSVPPPSRSDVAGVSNPLSAVGWPSLAPPTLGAFPAFAAADAVGVDDEVPGSDPLDIASLLPGGGDGAEPADVAPDDLSPELAALLRAAEQRVAAARVSGPSSVPSPAGELDLVLPPDQLSLLDEPLDDDGGGTGSAFATGALLGPATRGGETSALGGTGARLDAPSLSEPVASDDLPRREQTSPDASVAPIAPSSIASALSETSITTGAARAQQASPAEVAPASSAVSVAAPAASHASPSMPSTELELPGVLAEGDALRALARAIAARASGSLALGADAGPRRIVLRDGDIVTAAAGIADETLVGFLAERGDLERDVAARLVGKVPPFGRHAGAALVAHGHLGQDELWPVLRAHAEWLIGRAVLEPRGTCQLEHEAPGRLGTEPSVFGGATGAEVFVETVRRVVSPAEAMSRLGGARGRFEDGARAGLLGECALHPDESEALRTALGKTVAEVLQGQPPELANVLYALTALGVLEVRADSRAASGPVRAPSDPLDEEALRERVRARRLLVDDGDYFALLGVPRAATGYEIRRAYLELRSSLEPARQLTAATADLGDELRLILEVLEEAYDILREPHRRERYRRAIEVGPP